jgi:hypothetical protein
MMDDGPTTTQQHRPIPAGTVAIILLVLAALVVAWVCIKGVTTMREEYRQEELNRTLYAQDNYTITGELYAVTPDGVEVVEDETGRLWEIPGLHITRHDRLLLEVRNGNAVVNVWRRAWTLNEEGEG